MTERGIGMRRAAYSLATCITICSLPIQAMAQTSPPPPDDQQQMIKSLGAFGFALGGMVQKVAQDSNWTQPASASDSQKALESVVKGYKLTRDGGTGSVALLDASFETALTGIDITTAGSSLVATMGVRWVKREALDALSSKIADDAGKSLAAGINSYLQSQGMTYEDLQKAPTDQIKAALDQVPAFKTMESQLGDDAVGKGVLDEAATQLIVTTSKTTIDQLAQTQQDVAGVQGELTSLVQSFSQYKTDTSTTITNITDQLAGVTDQIDNATSAISDLAKQSDITSEDLAKTQNFMFSQATAKQRKMMLDSGFLDDLKQSNPQAYDAVKQETEAAAKRDELVGQMKDIADKFDDVGKIAQNLGINIPGLSEVVTVADTANAVVSDIASGDYLGAIVGFTGLFGSHTDPLAAFEQKLFGYLDGQFKQVNEKLDEIISGQKQIMNGMVDLSNQMAAYDQDTQDHLFQLQYDVQNIEDTNRMILYWPLASCDALRKAIINGLNNQKINPPDLTQFDQARMAADIDVGNSAAYCINYLRALYGVAFTPTSFGFAPLALRYQNSVQPTDIYVEKTDPAKVNQYEGAIQKFTNDQYRPAYNFFSAALAGANPFGAGVSLPKGLPLTAGMAAAALPAQGVPDFQKKMTGLAKAGKACAQGSVLGEPLVNILCQDPNNPSMPTLHLLTLPKSSTQPMEDNAQQTTVSLMSEPLVQDSLIDLANWAEFFAPLSDYTDPDTGKVYKDFAQFLAAPQIRGSKGEALISGALQTLTVGLAQGDMLYGDVTANLIFNALWDDSQGFTFPDKPSPVQTQALALLQSPNPYLQANVLMFAMDRAMSVSGETQRFAYDQALDLMANADLDPSSQLRVLFGDKLRFTNLWRPLKKADSNNPDAVKACQDPKNASGCAKIPAAVIFDGSNEVDIPLPSSDAFTARAFTYPRYLLEMLGTRDRMATHIADYEAFNTAVAQDSDPTGAAARIAQTVIKAYQ